MIILCRDLAVIVASMAYNTWFTKLYCKDLRIVRLNVLLNVSVILQVKCFV